MAKIKIHNINIELLEEGTGKADGAVTVSLDVSGLNNAAKAVDAYQLGKEGLKEYKKDLNILNILSLALAIYNILKRGEK